MVVVYEALHPNSLKEADQGNTTRYLLWLIQNLFHRFGWKGLHSRFIDWSRTPDNQVFFDGTNSGISKNHALEVYDMCVNVVTMPCIISYYFMWDFVSIKNVVSLIENNRD